MTTGILLAIATGLLWTGFAVLLSRVIRRGEDVPSFMLLWAIPAAVAAWAVFPHWHELARHGAPRLGWLCLLALLTGGFGRAAVFALSAAMRRGHQGTSWSVGQCAMVVPFVASIVFWGDSVRVAGGVGVALIAATIVLTGLARPSGDEAHAAHRGWFALVLVTFAAFGISQVMATIPSRWVGWSDAAGLRTPLFVTSNIVASGAICLFRRNRFTKYLLWAGLLQGLMNAAATGLFFRSMDLLEKGGALALAYPLAVGTCILGFTAYSALVIRERFTWRQYVAMGLGLAGIGLVAAGGASAGE